MLGSVTSVCLEGAYAHYHPEVVDILFWALLDTMFEPLLTF